MANKSQKANKPKQIVKNGQVYGDALSAQEKKRIVMQKKKDRKAKKIPKSAQQTIPYVEMCKDGICKVNSRLYTKTIRYNDINYQLAQNEDKTAIFENWCDFLNYFDSSIFVQLSFINQRADIREFRKQITIPEQQDAFNDIRKEYSDMLQDQLTKGNRIHKCGAHTVSLKKNVCNTRQHSSVERILRLCFFCYYADPLVNALNFLRRMEKLHI